MTRDEVLSELRCAIETVESILKYNKAKLQYYKKYDKTGIIIDKVYIEHVREQIDIYSCLIHTLKESKYLIERRIVR